METREKQHVIRNLLQLVENTTCSVDLLVRLQAKGILSEFEVEQLQNESVPRKSSQQLYKIVQTRPVYKLLIDALDAAKQSGASKILKELPESATNNNEEKLLELENTTTPLVIPSLVVEKDFSDLKLSTTSNSTSSSPEPDIDKLLLPKPAPNKVPLPSPQNALCYKINHFCCFYWKISLLVAAGIVLITAGSIYFSKKEKVTPSKLERLKNGTYSEQDMFASLTKPIQLNRPIKEIQDLARNGLDLRMKNKNGRTAMHIAAYYGNVEAIRYLVSVGLSVNDKDSFGNTPLHLGYGHWEVLKILVELKANLLEANNDANTFVHLAAKTTSDKYFDKIKGFIAENCILQAEELFGMKNKDGFTALELRNRVKGSVSNNIKEKVTNISRPSK